MPPLVLEKGTNFTVKSFKENIEEKEGDFNSCFWFQNIQIFIIFYTYAAYPFAKNDRGNQNLFDIFEIAMENFTLEKELCIVVKIIGEI